MTKQFLLVFAAVALAHGTFPALAAGEDPPLVVAASKGDIVQVRRLLANGTDPNAHDTGNLTALNWAAYNGHLAVVQALVERGATVDSNSNSHGWTPLMNAANRGHTDVVKYLLSRGADARLASKDGYVMAIGYAVLGGHDDTAHVLRNSAAGAMHYGGNEVVLFINNSSSVVAVSLDGKQVCSLNPGGRCHGFLSTGDADLKHPVHAAIGGRTWDDRISISECHWNWNGLKTYTFTNNKVPFDCRK